MAKKNDGELIFLPLGGSGEIGMNLNLYGYGDQWLMVDCGVTFGDDATPGFDVMMPDPAFIVERREKLVGMVLTHGHEDHIGAVAHIWPQLRCPIFATKFTAELLRSKLAAAGLTKDAKITEIPLSGSFEVGAFALEFVTLTHSILEPNAVIIRTPVGTIVHTGDWKLDPDPLVGGVSDIDALRRAGDEGVLAVIGDSTNALVDGDSVSEAEVAASLREVIGRYKGRVTVACFASNVARLHSIVKAAQAHDRTVALVGRSLWRITEAARATGYLDDLPDFITEHDVGYLPNDKVLLICTGSQGEPRAALARIARGDHPEIRFGANDTVIFSSRIIPGNELSIGRLQNMLASQGVTIVDEKSEFIHVSGHPNRGDLEQMYAWVRPQIAVPVHGEFRHMAAHAKLALSCQVPFAPTISNGDVLRLAPGQPEIIDTVKTGRLAVDGGKLIPIDGGIARGRRQMMWNGSATASLALDEDGRMIGRAKLAAPGLIGETADDGAFTDEILDAIEDWVDTLPAKKRNDDKLIEEYIRRKLRRLFRDELGKRPPTTIHVMRV